jgi:RHS repeat-associated protein
MRIFADLGVSYTTQSSSSESIATNSSENTKTSIRTSEGSGSVENTLAINIMNIIGRPTSYTLKSLQYSTMSLEQAYPNGGGAIGEEMPQIGEDPGGYPSQARILYWYHPDYIQNVDLVTDLDGEAYELFLYNPWGEQLHHWSSNSSSWTSPYRFNAKEVDPETGLAYYGARYYQNKIGVWLSVDPMTSNRIWLTPYQFVQNSPNLRIDPNGKLDWKPDGNGGYIAEPGDGAETLARDANISRLRAYSLMEEQGFGTYSDNGVLKSNISPGDKVFVSQGQNETPISSDLLSHASSSNSRISTAIGMVGDIMKSSKSTFKLSKNKGIDFRVYPSGWLGNQYVKTTQIKSLGKFVGNATLLFGVLNDVVGLNEYFTNGPGSHGAVSPPKAGINTVIGAYGAWGGLGGGVVAPVYFGFEAFYPGGYVKAMEDNADRNERVSMVLGKYFNPMRPL